MAQDDTQVGRKYYEGEFFIQSQNVIRLAMKMIKEYLKPPWWRTRNHEFIHKCTMDDEHIRNCINLIRRWPENKRLQLYLPVFEEELVKRTGLRELAAVIEKDGEVAFYAEEDGAN